MLDSEFQTVGPVTEKALRPNVVRLWRSTSISCLLADRRCCLPGTSATGVQQSLRYCGAEPYWQRCTNTLSLYSMRWGTSSQWRSSCSSCDRPRSNFWVSLTTRAAAVLNRLARHLLSVAPWCDTTEQSEHFWHYTGGLHVCCLISNNKYLTSLMCKIEFFSIWHWQSMMYTEDRSAWGGGGSARCAQQWTRGTDGLEITKFLQTSFMDGP